MNYSNFPWAAKREYFTPTKSKAYFSNLQAKWFMLDSALLLLTNLPSRTPFPSLKHFRCFKNYVTSTKFSNRVAIYSRRCNREPIDISKALRNELQSFQSVAFGTDAPKVSTHSWNLLQSEYPDSIPSYWVERRIFFNLSENKKTKKTTTTLQLHHPRNLLHD